MISDYCAIADDSENFTHWESNTNYHINFIDPLCQQWVTPSLAGHSRSTPLSMYNRDLFPRGESLMLQHDGSDHKYGIMMMMSLWCSLANAGLRH